jgi:hypothetical protein
MKYPFEQTKDYSKKFLDYNDTKEFNNLKNLVNTLNEEGVDKWFSIQNERLKIKGKENLAKAIGNTTYYFSIKTNKFLNKKEIENIENQQYKILLKHFKLEEQLMILSQAFEFESEEIFQLIYQNAKKENKKNIFYSSRIILDSLSKIFYKEYFDKLKRIEKYIEKNLVEIKNSYMAFFIENGSYYYKLENNYTLTDQIIINYSDNKREFILSYGKELPLKSKADQLLEDIKNFYKQKDYFSKRDQEILEKLNKNIENYIKIILFFEFNKKLPNKSLKGLLNKI